MLDNQRKQVSLHGSHDDANYSHIVLSPSRSVLLINDIKTGVTHLVNLLGINEKLLSNLPNSNPPFIR